MLICRCHKRELQAEVVLSFGMNIAKQSSSPGASIQLAFPVAVQGIGGNIEDGGRVLSALSTAQLYSYL